MRKGDESTKPADVNGSLEFEERAIGNVNFKKNFFKDSHFVEKKTLYEIAQRTRGLKQYLRVVN